MKKKMFAALSAAVLLCGVLTAPAAALDYWWSEKTSDFSCSTTLMDDRGMFAGVASGQMGRDVPEYKVYTDHLEYNLQVLDANDETGEETKHVVEDRLYVVWPTENQISFVLRDGLDEAEAEQKIFKILEQYYPGIAEKARQAAGRLDPYILSGTFQARTYTLYDNSVNTGNEQIADEVKYDLAKAGLISEFYTWGETSRYIAVEPERYLTAYIPAQYDDYNEQHPDSKIEIEWDTVQTWISEHHPECECRYVMPDETELLREMLILTIRDEQPWRLYPDAPVFAVIPPEGISFAEHFAIATELYAQFGIRISYGIPEGNSGIMLGQNALATAGDINLDCAVDVADAVLVARFAAEDKEAVITDQGKENADVTHDGNVDGQDAEKILQYIAKKISYADLTE